MAYRRTGRVNQTPISMEVRDDFVQFSRNGRWGTCIECPRDNNNDTYPEFCPNTDRNDHQLDVDKLAQHHKNFLKVL